MTYYYMDSWMSQAGNNLSYSTDPKVFFKIDKTETSLLAMKKKRIK